ncbi:hypothetical protein [Streptomyces luteireticuli]|uniref:hypothetical protein n=1 Tax=Streptomyces luteireticuli TaxID=173858 RepID=UPI003556F148
MSTTAAPRRPHLPKAPVDCDLVRNVARVETPMITEMVAAMFHLERLAQRVGTPQEEVEAYEGRADLARHRRYVLDADARIRRALDQLTEPYAKLAGPEVGEATAHAA